MSGGQTLALLLDPFMVVSNNVCVPRKLCVLLSPVSPLSPSSQTHSGVSQGLATVATRKAVQTQYVDLWTTGDEYTA
jgi:hypothetical protein